VIGFINYFKVKIMNTLIAINPKYTGKVNRAYKWMRTYHELVNIEAPTKGQEREQENAFYKYVELFEELPKREQTSFNRQHKKLHGYT
jgi:hypothetical protein